MLPAKAYDISSLISLFPLFFYKELLCADIEIIKYNDLYKGDDLFVDLLLCSPKSDTLSQLTLFEDNPQFYAAKHMSFLPMEEAPKRELWLDNFKSPAD